MVLFIKVRAFKQHCGPIGRAPDWNLQDQNLFLVLLLTYCVTLNKSLHGYVPQFPLQHFSLLFRL